MSEQPRQSVSEQSKNTLLQEARHIVNTKTAALALSVATIIGCTPDKEITEAPNEAPKLGVSIKSVSTTDFVLDIDYTDDQEGGRVDYVVLDKTTGEQIADGQMSADKKTLYIGSLQPEQSYQTKLEGIDSEGAITLKNIDVTTTAIDIAPPVAPTLSTSILNILENSTDPVAVTLTSVQAVAGVTLTGETANFLDVQSFEQIGTTNDYTITLKPHDLDRETAIGYLGGLNVQTSSGATELTLNIGVLNENEPTPTLFDEAENERGTTGEYFVFKLEDNFDNHFYTHNGSLQTEVQVKATAESSTQLSGSLTTMINDMIVTNVMPKHSNGVPYFKLVAGVGFGSDVGFQDENENVLKVMPATQYWDIFGLIRDRIMAEGVEDFSNENGFQNADYFSGGLLGNVCEGFTIDLINKLYTDWVLSENPTAPESIAKFIVEKRLYNTVETE